MEINRSIRVIKDMMRELTLTNPKDFERFEALQAVVLKLELDPVEKFDLVDMTVNSLVFLVGKVANRQLDSYLLPLNMSSVSDGILSRWGRSSAVIGRSNVTPVNRRFR